MATLQERNAPKARVFAYIKDPVYGGNGKNSTRKFVELNGATSINSNISMSGMGTATVTFNNFKSSRLRFINENSVLLEEQETLYNNGVATSVGAASEFINTITQESDTYFKGLWNDMVFSDGTTEINKQSWALGSQSRADLVADSSAMNIRNKIRGEYKPGEIEQYTTIHALPFLNNFDPIFIDYIGQDGLQYAGFTGLISRISDSYTKTGDQSYTIQCNDLTTLLDNVSVVSGWHREGVAETQAGLADALYSSEANKDAATSAAFTNIFSSDKYNKVTDIILALVKTSQEMWRLDNVDIPDVGVKAFMFDTSQVYEYNGLSGRRGSVQHIIDNSGNSEQHYTQEAQDIKPETFANKYDLYKQHYMYMNVPETEGKLRPSENVHSLKRIFVDPLIMQMDNMFIHKMLSNSLSLYKDSLKSADSIINDICAKILAYKYFDANGNMIIELAKYNSIPNMVKYGGRSTGVVVTHKDPDADNKAKTVTKTVTTAKIPKGYTKLKFASKYGMKVDEFIELNNGYTNSKVFVYIKEWKTGEKNYYVLREGAVARVKPFEVTETQEPVKRIKKLTVESDGSKVLDKTDTAYKWSTTLFHGKNYVLTNDDFVSFSTTIDEAALTTLVATDANYSYLDTVSEDLRLSSAQLHGVAIADKGKIATLGVRRFQTQNLYNVAWPKYEQGARVLSHMSAAVMARMNAQADSGTIMLNHRPELQLGRTYMNPLRMKSYLIMGINNSWSPGSDHTTSLTISYGKPLHQALETPWSAIYSEPKVFGFKDVAEFRSLIAANAHSNVKKDEKLKKINEGNKK